MEEIDSRVGLSVDEFGTRYLSKELPVVVRQAGADWPAISRWTDAHLKAHAGAEIVELRPKADYSAGTSQRTDETVSKVSFAEVVDLMGRADAPDLSYVRQTNLLERVPSLLEDVVRPPYLPRDSGAPAAWFGPAGTIAQLHWDPAHNLFMQVRGQKRVILVPPEHSASTYPNRFAFGALARLEVLTKRLPFVVEPLQRLAAIEGYDELPEAERRAHLSAHLSMKGRMAAVQQLAAINNSHVDAENPDYSLHPRFAEARRLTTLLSPGDLLYIPALWRHYVRSLSTSISVNWFFDARACVEREATRGNAILDHLGVRGE